MLTKEVTHIGLLSICKEHPPIITQIIEVLQYPKMGGTIAIISHELASMQ